MTADSLVHLHPHPHGVVEIVLNRTSAMNAVSTDLAKALTDCANHVATDPKARCVVLSSASAKAFCVGADLKERNGFSDDDLRKQRPIARAAYRSILDLPMPTIAAVDGYALGGGMELALSCDLIVAGQAAVFGLPEVSVGVIPGGGGTQLLVRRVGWSKAAEVIFTARKMLAEEAAELGIINRVVPAGDVRAAAVDLANSIAKHSPLGLKEAKRAMRQGMAVDLPTGLDIEDGAWRTVAFSGDRVEGVKAFAEKRTPNWPGE